MFKRFAWMLLLIVSLVFTQGMRAHIHVYDHDHADPVVHVEQAHSAYSVHDAERGDHPGPSAEINVSADGMLAKLFLDLSILAFVLGILFVLSHSSSQRTLRRPRLTPLPRSTNASSPPPLRAPPR